MDACIVEELALTVLGQIPCRNVSKARRTQNKAVRQTSRIIDTHLVQVLVVIVLWQLPLRFEAGRLLGGVGALGPLREEAAAAVVALLVLHRAGAQRTLAQRAEQHPVRTAWK